MPMQQARNLSMVHPTTALCPPRRSCPPTPRGAQVFLNLPTEVGATEAEEIGVEHLLRDVKDASVSTLASEVRSRAGGGGQRVAACDGWHACRRCCGDAGGAVGAGPHAHAPQPPSLRPPPLHQVGDMVAGLRGLRSRLLEMREYLEAVAGGRLPVNHDIMRGMQARAFMGCRVQGGVVRGNASPGAACGWQRGRDARLQTNGSVASLPTHASAPSPLPPPPQDIFNLLPNLNVAELSRSFSAGANDMLLVLYLASLVRAVLALHDLIDNKQARQFYEKERVSEKEGGLHRGQAAGRTGSCPCSPRAFGGCKRVQLSAPNRPDAHDLPAPPRTCSKPRRTRPRLRRRRRRRAARRRRARRQRQRTAPRTPSPPTASSSPAVRSRVCTRCLPRITCVT